jgi:hypothetical protein
VTLGRSAGALLVLLSAAGAPRAAAQGWVVDASAGGAEHEPVAAEIDTRSAMLGVGHEGVPWLYLAAGTPLDSEGLPWAAGGVGARLETRRFGVGLGADLGAHAFGYRDPVLDASGSGATLEALPFVALSRGAARLELSSGVLHHRSGFAGDVPLQQTVHRSAALLSYAAAPGVRVFGEARLARADEGDFPFAGVGAEVAFARGELRAGLGRWMDDAMTTPVWSVGGSARLTDRIRVRASLEQESEDPLYWNLPRRSWNVGVSHALGRVRELPAPAAVAPQASDGRVTLRLPLEEAPEPPAVGGDFNDWQPTPMTRAGDEWTLTLPLAPGVYRYAFRRADGSWFVPESVPNRVDDGFGGHSAVLIVPAAPGG